MKLSSALQELKLKFNSADTKFAGLEQGKEYLLSSAEDKSAIENALGISLPEVGATEAVLDFTSLLPQLMTDKGATVTSTIEVDVKANNRWASEDATVNRVYTLKCNKPEFSIVTNPGNFWCKEFSVDSCDIKTGDIETISQKIQYQYRKKGDEQWIDCDRLVQFDDYPVDKQYQIRAVYREGIETEPVDVMLETPQQLPNSDMEEWYIEEKKNRVHGLLRIKLITLSILMQKVMPACLGGQQTTIKLKEERMLWGFGMKVALHPVSVIQKMLMEVQKLR